MSTLASFKKRMVKRKYKERHQPEWRKKKGFLEKKVDYKKRAKKFTERKEMYQKLSEKAQLKNENEFYFKMINSKSNVR